MHQLSEWIDINPTTGEWTVGDLPMVLVPRHYFAGIQKAGDAKFGIQAMRDLMHAATFEAAKRWCAHEANRLGLSGSIILQHYLSEVTRRGLGNFTIEQLDIGTGVAAIRLERSCIAVEYPIETKRRVCYVFASAIEGGLAYILEQQSSTRRIVVHESQCIAAGDASCLFAAHSEPASI